MLSLLIIRCAIAIFFDAAAAYYFSRHYASFICRHASYAIIAYFLCAAAIDIISPLSIFAAFFWFILRRLPLIYADDAADYLRLIFSFSSSHYFRLLFIFAAAAIIYAFFIFLSPHFLSFAAIISDAMPPFISYFSHTADTSFTPLRFCHLPAMPLDLLFTMLYLLMLFIDLLFDIIIITTLYLFLLLILLSIYLMLYALFTDWFLDAAALFHFAPLLHTPASYAYWYAIIILLLMLLPSCLILRLFIYYFHYCLYYIFFFSPFIFCIITYLLRHFRHYAADSHYDYYDYAAIITPYFHFAYFFSFRAIIDIFIGAIIYCCH